MLHSPGLNAWPRYQWIDWSMKPWKSQRAAAAIRKQSRAEPDLGTIELLSTEQSRAERSGNSVWGLDEFKHFLCYRYDNNRLRSGASRSSLDGCFATLAQKRSSQTCDCLPLFFYAPRCAQRESALLRCIQRGTNYPNLRLPCLALLCMITSDDHTTTMR